MAPIHTELVSHEQVAAFARINEVLLMLVLAVIAIGAFVAAFGANNACCDRVFTLCGLLREVDAITDEMLDAHEERHLESMLATADKMAGVTDFKRAQIKVLAARAVRTAVGEVKKQQKAAAEAAASSSLLSRLRAWVGRAPAEARALHDVECKQV